MRRPKPNTEQLEGYELDAKGVYICTFNSAEEPCSKTYVRKDAAVRHYAIHQAYLENESRPTIEEHGRRGGQSLRDMADQLEKGIINVPDLVWKLRASATVVDMLLKEVEVKDLRALRRKADNWDIVAQQVYKELEATNATHASGN